MSAAPAPRPVLASNLVPLAVAVAVLLGMQARFMGDTVDYVNNSFEFGPDARDFGHLVRVPLGSLARGLGRDGVLWTFLVVNAVAGVALAAWADGGDVWLSKRLLEDAPRADSTRAEGEDARLKWADVRAFFAALGVYERVGGDDGFVRLRGTAAQRDRLRDVKRR